MGQLLSSIRAREGSLTGRDTTESHGPRKLTKKEKVTAKHEVLDGKIEQAKAKKAVEQKVELGALGRGLSITKIGKN